MRLRMKRSECSAIGCCFRRWWAGRKYAQYAAKTGETEKLIAEKQTACGANPSNTAARLLLAYLYEAKGDQASAEKMWAVVDPNGKRSRTVAGRSLSRR